MMNLLSKKDGYMNGLSFKDNAELAKITGEHETMSFEVRRAKDCVELHITHYLQGKGRQRANARHMIHCYAPEAFAELVALLNSVAEPRP
ncbi:MAG: hypothetical protein ABFD60_10625 [Bryobacteraceae bacterium]